mgnify:CR=1 FL=1
MLAQTINTQETLVLAMPLTEEERGELTRCEHIIEQGLPTVFEVGKAFKTIIDRKLYRETHKTAEDYFREKWDLSRPRAYQLIDGATVRDNVEAGLSTTGRQNMPLPTTERQTRALKQAPAEKQAELWQAAVDANNGHAPNSRQIIQVIETEFREYKPKTSQKKQWRIGDYYESRKYNIVKILQYDSNADTVYIQEMIRGEKMWINPSELGASCTEEYLLLTTESEERMYFNMLFDVDDFGECERLKRIVFLSEIYNRPLMADAARTKGWCATCPYDSTGHYLNEKGFKWCTLTIMNDLKLRDILKTNKNQTYAAAVPASVEDNDEDAEEPEPNPAMCVCEYCGEEYLKEQLYWAPEDISAICRTCAAQAQIALLHSDDPEVTQECQRIEHLMIKGTDRDKIMRSGLRLYRPIYQQLTNGSKEILMKQYTPSNGNLGDGWGSWKTIETFLTKKALQDRVRELERDPEAILDGHI